MIALNDDLPVIQEEWQFGFLEILPEIEGRLRGGFCRLSPRLREESTGDGIVHCMLAYVRLFEQGREKSVRPASLVWYARLQMKMGRQAGISLNVRDPLSRYAQIRQGIRIERLPEVSEISDRWIEPMIEDQRTSVAEQVAARLDIRAWFATLSNRSKQIARLLAHGFSTAEVARQNGVSASRISQVRRELEASWNEFQGDGVTAAV